MKRLTAALLTCGIVASAMLPKSTQTGPLWGNCWLPT